MNRAFAGRKPVTWYSLDRAKNRLRLRRRRSLERHLTAVQKLIDEAAT